MRERERESVASSAERRETSEDYEEHYVGDSASEENDVEASQSEYIQENTSDSDISDETNLPLLRGG